MSDVSINIRLVTAAAQAQANQLQKSLVGVDKAADGASKSAKNLGSSLSSVGQVAKGVFLGNLLQSALFGITQTITETIFAFTDFEEALIGVGKTTGIAGTELKELGEDIEELSREIPVATTELLEIAKVAGQLGVRGSRNLTKFTEVVAKLGATTDLQGEDAALTLSRLLTITGEGVDTVGALGAVIVELGNNFAATESEIAAVALDVGRGTAQFGLASREVLALATALKETGVQAEISGTQIGRVLREIQNAAVEGGPRLEKFAEILGVSSDEVQNFLDEDPSQVLFNFVGGLKSLQDQGIATNITLAQLGLNNDRIQKVIPSLVKNYDGLTDALERANFQYEQQTALNEEAERQFESQAAQIQILGNEFTELQKEISEAFAPITNVVIERLRSIIGFSRDGAQALKELLNPEEEDLTQLTAAQTVELEKLNAELALAQRRADAATISFNELDEAQRKGNETTFFGRKVNEETIKQQAILVRTAREEAQAIRDRVAAKREEFGLETAPEAQAAAETPEQAAQKQREVETAKIDVIRQFAEVSAAEREAQQLLADEQQAIRTEEDIENFKQSLITKALIDEQAKLDELARENKQLELKKKLIQIETQAENAAQKERDKIQQREVAGRRQVNDDLNELGKAGAKEAFAIQKALAIQSAIVSSAEAELNAIAFGTKLGGPALGAVFGAISKAATVARIANIASAKTPAFQDGGIVPGNSFSGDNVAARVNSGEVILNRQQQAQTLFAIANGQGAGGSGQSNQEMVVNTTVEIDGEAVATAVSRQVADGFKLGENQ